MATAYADTHRHVETSHEYRSTGECGAAIGRWLREESGVPGLPNRGDLRFDERVITREKRFTDGSALQPVNVLADLVFESLALANPIFDLATKVPPSGISSAVALIDDDSQTGELLDEGDPSSQQAIALGRVTPTRYTFGSKRIACSVELVQDGQLLIDNLPRILGTRIGRVMGTYFTTGTGTGQPRGVVTAASDSGVTAAGQVPTMAELIDVKYSVDALYHKSPACVWMWHPAKWKAFLKSIDANIANLIESHPDGPFLLGHRVALNSSMPTAAESKAVLFGDVSRYVIPCDNVLSFQRLNELYMANRLIGFHAWMRAGGDLADASAIKFLTLAA